MTENERLLQDIIHCLKYDVTFHHSPTKVEISCPDLLANKLIGKVRAATLKEVGKWLKEQEIGDTDIIELYTDDDWMKSLLKGELPDTGKEGE